MFMSDEQKMDCLNDI